MTDYRQIYVNRGIWETWHDKTWEDYTDDFYKEKVQGFVKDDSDKNILLYGNNGTGKCFGKGTEILMYDGSIKNVEDIVVGDLLMGDDSTPRKVLSLARGREKMYIVRQKNGNPYRVNESHILSLKGCGQWKGKITNISVKDYLKKSKLFKACNNGYKVPVYYDYSSILIDPYFLGLWLGDGDANSTTITSNDIEVVEYLQKFADSIGQKISKLKHKNRCDRFNIIDTKNSRSNRLLDKMIHYNLIKSYSIKGREGYKHIPKDYLINTEDVRLLVLAGLLDSDGHYSKRDNGFDITQKSKTLADDIVTLSRSLGFRTTIKPKIAKIKSTGYECQVYRITIYGNLDKIPTKIKRKKARHREINKDPLVSGIELIPDGIDDYYGFTITGNRLFLLSDYTVVHNTMLMNLAFKDMIVYLKKDVQVIDFRNLVKEYVASWRDNGRLPELLDCDCLGIDDLGKEFNSGEVSKELAVTTLDYVLRYRIQREKPVWMTFNMMLSDVETTYNKHIASLIKRSSIALPFDGEDYGDKLFKKVSR